MQSFFVTGTDAGVGKTYVTLLLLKALREQRIDAVGFKPVDCGDRQDPRALREAGPDGLSLEQINPLYYKSPTVPYAAARFENREVDFEAVRSAFDALQASHECVLTEGIGGWETPLSHGKNLGDLAAMLNLPVILVVGHGHGALSHAILTANAIKARGLTCAGIIFNNAADEWDSASVTNRGVIEELTGVPVIAELIHGQDYIDTDSLIDALG